MDQNLEDRFHQLEEKISSQRKTNRLLSLSLLVSLMLGASQYDWIKKAFAAIGTPPYLELGDTNSMGTINSSTVLNGGTTATEIQSTNSTNTLKVIQATGGTGIALHAVNNGSGNAVHAWAGGGGNGVRGLSTQSNGVYGQSDTTLNGVDSVAGVHGYSAKGSGVFGNSVKGSGIHGHSEDENGGSFSIDDYSIRGQIKLDWVQHQYRTVTCTPGEIRYEKNVNFGQITADQLLFCVHHIGTAEGIWKAVQLSDNVFPEGSYYP